MPSEHHRSVARRFQITGRVQGVGFRHFTMQAAARERVRGWVRNTVDGGVEIEAAGAGDDLTRFEAAIRKGPIGARVDHVDAIELSTTPAFDGFQMRA